MFSDKFPKKLHQGKTEYEKRYDALDIEAAISIPPPLELDGWKMALEGVM